MMKKIAPTLVVPLLIAIFLSLKNDLFKGGNKAQDNSESNLSASSDKITSEVDVKALSILGDRCRGCGKCVRIDPEHFEMNGRVAKVISSKNLGSTNLKMAINNCQDEAILLK
ncbi:MAG TPA: ferredoxin [Candidatus Methanoperedens sp.]|nr:ferredoxin [Candidatus Methanoperedens sp.]